MIARLLLDAMWRSRWSYLAVTVFLIPCWLMYVAGDSGFLEISMPALSLMFVAMLGPLFATTTMGLRALRHMPVTNRDLWRATWVVATVVSSGLLLATKMASVFLVVA